MVRRVVGHAVRRVVIVGGGVGGLALAATLDPGRFEVVVAEADPGREVVGAALGLWPSARRALQRIGASVDASTSEPGDAALHDLTGRALVRGTGPEVLLVRRPRVLAALTAAVPSTVQRLTSEVTRPEDLDADLVVGADGVRSRVRGLVWSRGIARVESDFVAMRGVVPDPTEPGDTTAYGEYWGPGVLFGLMPLGDGDAYWFSAHRSRLGPEPLGVDTVAAELVERVRGGPAVARRVLDLADQETLANRLWLAPPLPRYVHGRYVVVGDAAHASLPNLGRGACDAILDAVSLGDALNAGGSLTAWQARRLPPTQVARVAATGLMRLAVLDRGAGLRDRFLDRVGHRGRSSPSACESRSGPA